MPESPIRAEPRTPREGEVGRTHTPTPGPRSRAETSATSAEHTSAGRAPRSCCTRGRAPPAKYHPRARRAAERSNGRHAVRKSSFRPCSTTWHTIFLLRGGGAAGSPHRPAPAPGVRGFGIASSRHPDHAACTRYTRHQRRSVMHEDSTNSDYFRFPQSPNRILDSLPKLT